jgi:hypothetical protein
VMMVRCTAQRTIITLRRRVGIKRLTCPFGPGTGSNGSSSGGAPPPQYRAYVDSGLEPSGGGAR